MKTKKEIWALIKKDDPQLANFLTEINAKFGKPVKIEISINGETYQEGVKNDRSETINMSPKRWY